MPNPMQQGSHRLRKPKYLPRCFLKEIPSSDSIKKGIKINAENVKEIKKVEFLTNFTKFAISTAQEDKCDNGTSGKDGNAKKKCISLDRGFQNIITEKTSLDREIKSSNEINVSQKKIGSTADRETGTSLVDLSEERDGIIDIDEDFLLLDSVGEFDDNKSEEIFDSENVITVNEDISIEYIEEKSNSKNVICSDEAKKAPSSRIPGMPFMLKFSKNNKFEFIECFGCGLILKEDQIIKHIMSRQHLINSLKYHNFNLSAEISKEVDTLSRKELLDAIRNSKIGWEYYLESSTLEEFFNNRESKLEKLFKSLYLSIKTCNKDFLRETYIPQGIQKIVKDKMPEKKIPISNNSIQDLPSSLNNPSAKPIYVFVGNSYVTCKVADYLKSDFKSPLLVDVDYHRFNWDSVKEKVSKLNPTRQIIFFLIGDLSLIANKRLFPLCIDKNCESPLTHLLHQKPMSSKDMDNLFKFMETISEKSEKWSVIVLPLFPIYLIDSQLSSNFTIHPALHLMCPAYACLSDRSDWDFASKEFKSMWNKFAIEFSAKHCKRPAELELFFQLDLVLYKWENPTMFSLRKKSNYEMKWHIYFKEFLSKVCKCDFASDESVSATCDINDSIIESIHHSPDAVIHSNLKMSKKPLIETLDSDSDDEQPKREWRKSVDTSAPRLTLSISESHHSKKDDCEKLTIESNSESKPETENEFYSSNAEGNTKKDLSSNILPSKRPFDRIFIFGESSLLSLEGLVDFCPITRQYHKLNTFTDKSIDYLKLFLEAHRKDFKVTNPACLILLDLTTFLIFTRIPSKSHCSMKNCKDSISMAVIKKALHQKSFTPRKIICQRICLLTSILEKLSNDLPVFVLPLSPKVLYFIEKHKFEHGVLHQIRCGHSVLMHDEQSWISNFDFIQEAWIALLKDNWEKYFPASLVESLISKIPLAFTLGEDTSDYAKPPPTIDQWNLFVIEFLQAIRHENNWIESPPNKFSWKHLRSVDQVFTDSIGKPQEAKLNESNPANSSNISVIPSICRTSNILPPPPLAASPTLLNANFTASTNNLMTTCNASQPAPLSMESFTIPPPLLTGFIPSYPPCPYSAPPHHPPPSNIASFQAPAIVPLPTMVPIHSTTNGMPITIPPPTVTTSSMLVNQFPQPPISYPITPMIYSAATNCQMMVIEVCNISTLLPMEMFKDIAAKIEPQATISAPETISHKSKVCMNFHSLHNAGVAMTRLDGLRIIVCTLEVVAISKEVKHVDHQDLTPKNDISDIIINFENQIISNIKLKLEENLDLSSFMVVPCSGCNNPSSCLRYHSRAECRRNPFSFGYRETYCHAFQNEYICPRSLNCMHCHTKSEWHFHPLAFQTLQCPNETSGKCPDKPICRYAHKDTPEMLFTTYWKDVVLCGFWNSFWYLDGAIRGRCKDSKLSGHKILFVSSSEGLAKTAFYCITDTLKNYNLNAVYVTKDFTKGFVDPNVIIGSLPNVLRFISPLLDFEYAAIIVDGAGKLLRNRQFSSDIMRLFLKSLESTDQLYPNKILVINEKEKHSTYQDLIKRFKLNETDHPVANSSTLSKSIMKQHTSSSRKRDARNASIRKSKSPLRKSKAAKSYSKSLTRNSSRMSRVVNSRSPQGHIRSLIEYSRSPKRHIQSTRRLSRSPQRNDRSQWRLARSPPRYSRSPQRYSRSPRRYSRSPRHLKSPKRQTRSPLKRIRLDRQKHSGSPRRFSRSSQPRNSRSPCENIEFQSKTRGNIKQGKQLHTHKKISHSRSPIDETRSSSNSKSKESRLSPLPRNYFTNLKKPSSPKHDVSHIILGKPQSRQIKMPQVGSTYSRSSNPSQKSFHLSPSYSTKSPSPNRSSTSKPDLRIDGISSHLESKKTIELEKAVKKKIDEDFHIYEEFPEIHPDYVEKYGQFVTEYRREYGNTFDEIEEHLENCWLHYWKEFLAKLKAKEFAEKISHVKGNNNLSKEDIVETFDLLDSIKDHLGIVGAALAPIMKECRSQGVLSTASLMVLSSPESNALFKMLIEYLQQKYHSCSGFLKSTFESAFKATERLFDYAQNHKPVPKTKLNLDSISKVTLGKDPESIRDLIQTALMYEGVKDPLPSEVDELFVHVCLLQRKM